MRLTISIPDYLVKDIKQLAKDHGVTQSEVIGNAIYQAYAIKPRSVKKVRKAVATKKVPKGHTMRGATAR